MRRIARHGLVLAVLGLGLGPLAPAQVDEAGSGPAASPAVFDGSLLDAALQLARRDHPTLDEALVRRRIDALAAAWGRQLARATSPADRARSLHTVLMEQHGFKAVDELDSPQTLHVDSVLESRVGYCLSLSVVALAMAEALGEPLHGVAAPNHFFLRWDDGQEQHNIDLSSSDAPLTDDAWRERMGDFWYEGSIYLRNLRPAEVVAVLRHNRGWTALSAGRRELALEDLLASRTALPGLPEVHRSLGVLHGERKQWAEAGEAFEQALALYPGDVDALLNLALCRHALGQLEQAMEALKLTLILDPGRTRATELLTRWAAEVPGPPRSSRPLDEPPADLRPGLRGRYYRGMAHEKLVGERIARNLDFDWKRARPLPRAPADRFSARWSGWFRADTAGLYTLFVVANDGVRIRLGGALAVEHWESVGYSSWTGAGDVQLDAGWHTLQVDYFDDSDNARLMVIMSAEGDEYPLDLATHLFHEAP